MWIGDEDFLKISLEYKVDMLEKCFAINMSDMKGISKGGKGSAW